MKFVSPTSAVPGSADPLDVEQLLLDTRWEQLADLLPDGILLVDRTGFIRSMNSAAESIAELPRLEVVNRSLHHFVKQSAVDCGVLLDAFSGGLKVSKVVSTRGRQPCLLNARSVRASGGEMACFLITLRGAEQLNKLLSDAPGFEGGMSAAATEDPDSSMILSNTTTSLFELSLRALLQGSRILLLGESGVGKTEFARLLQRRSGIASRPFVHVNCGSIPETLFESEMFGYERGSFTRRSVERQKGAGGICPTVACSFWTKLARFHPTLRPRCCNSSRTVPSAVSARLTCAGSTSRSLPPPIETCASWWRMDHSAVTCTIASVS